MGPDKTNSTTNFTRDDRRPVNGNIVGELVPISDFVYVEPELQEGGQTESGIYVAKPKHQGPPNTGTVLAVGPDVKAIKVGQRVVFKDANAKGFWLNKVAHIPLKEEQIVAIISKEE